MLFLLQYKGIIIESWLDYNILLSLSSPSYVWIRHTEPYKQIITAADN